MGAVTRIQRNSYRLLALLNDLMLYIKAAAQQLDLQMDSFDPRALLKTLHADILLEAHTRALTVTLTGTDSLPETLVAPVDLTRHIVQELLGNAVKFSPSGEISIATAWQPDAATWVIRVHDCGPGIKPEHVSQIFSHYGAEKTVFKGRRQAPVLALDWLQRTP